MSRSTQVTATSSTNSSETGRTSGQTSTVARSRTASRLLSEITQAVVETVGADRTGVRLSLNGVRQGVNDSDPEPLFIAAALALSHLGIAYLEMREPGPDGTNGIAEAAPVAPAVRKAFAGPLILNSDYNGATAAAALDADHADAITFGRAFLANPDLPSRIRNGQSLASDSIETWYSRGSQGYTDYPNLAACNDFLEIHLTKRLTQSEPRRGRR